MRWKWDVRLEDGVSVFAIPPEAHKGGDYEHYRLVVLNSVARAVIEAQRGKQEAFVFVSKKTAKLLRCINNNPYQSARKAAGLQGCRVHDLKHYADVGISATLLRRASAPLVSPRKIAVPSSVTRCGLCPSSTRAPMSGAS